jgi:hypothetical protein
LSIGWLCGVYPPLFRGNHQSTDKPGADERSGTGTYDKGPDALPADGTHGRGYSAEELDARTRYAKLLFSLAESGSKGCFVLVRINSCLTNDVLW